MDMIRIFSSISFLAYAGVANASEPNLLVIMTDEHSFRTLGCYRKLLPDNQAFVWGDNNRVETPCLDFLASQGAVCSNYYSVSPVSSPARASFVTGMYPHVTGVNSNDKPMKDNMVTFAQTLLDHGYATGYAGKWHLDGEASPGWSPVRKFGFADNKYMYNSGHWKNIKEDTNGPYVGVLDKTTGEPTKFSIGDADDFPENYTTDFFADRTIDFIRRNKLKKFGFMVSFADPHGINIVRCPYKEMHQNMTFTRPLSAYSDITGMPSWATKADKTAYDRNEYPAIFGMVKCIDDNVGKILKALKDENILDNTIVVFTSDHGDLMGEHGLDDKGNPFETSAKIPFIIYYKGVIKAGSIVDKAMNSADFTPTILGLMGLQSTVDYQGKDYSSVLKSNILPEGWGNVTITRRGGWIAATDGKIKLIYSNVQGDVPVLFDLVNDPHELKNEYATSGFIPMVRQWSLFLKNHIYSTHDDPCLSKPKMLLDIENGINLESK